jgi:hypothetical protein
MDALKIAENTHKLKILAKEMIKFLDLDEEMINYEDVELTELLDEIEWRLS